MKPLANFLRLRLTLQIEGREHEINGVDTWRNCET